MLPALIHVPGLMSPPAWPRVPFRTTDPTAAGRKAGRGRIVAEPWLNRGFRPRPPNGPPVPDAYIFGQNSPFWRDFVPFCHLVPTAPVTPWGCSGDRHSDGWANNATCRHARQGVASLCFLKQIQGLPRVPPTGNPPVTRPECGGVTNICTCFRLSLSLTGLTGSDGVLESTKSEFLQTL